METVLIAAVSDNGAIGKDKALLWHLPADQRFLDGQIRDSWLITGRRSWESAQGQELFPGRQRVVLLTSRKGYDGKGAHIAGSLQEGLSIARQHGAARTCILGGQGVYEAAMPLADALILTEVHGNFAGDSYFPAIPSGTWEELRRENHEADAENPYPYSFVFYRRAKAE